MRALHQESIKVALVAAQNLRNSRHRAQHDGWLHWVLFGTGAIPWLGYWVVGSWSAAELGIGLLLMVLTARGVARSIVHT
jgi:hypothetical protein